MNKSNTRPDPPPRTSTRRLAVRCLSGAACGVFTCVFVVVGAISLPVASGPNAMASMFIGPAIVVVMSITAAVGILMGIIGAVCPTSIVLLTGTILTGIFAIWANCDPICYSLAPYAIAGVLGVTLAGRGVRKFLCHSSKRFSNP